MKKNMSLFIIICIGVVIFSTTIFFVYSSFGSLLDWYGIELPGNKTKVTTIYEAVAYKNSAEVERLLAEGADPNAPDYRGEVPILLAAATDQFQVIELLLEANVDIFATNSLGYNVGIYTSTSHVDPTSIEGLAQQRVIKKLTDRGFPWPPPFPDEVLKMKEENNWPPTQNVPE